jgi:acetyltransferase-like isoleucine patch superfamily enzyme
MDKSIKQNNTVEIGDGTRISENVCMLGARIGKNCVVGANSVVTSDIPDYCIVVGVPAKIIKRYDFHLNKWIKTDPDHFSKH